MTGRSRAHQSALAEVEVGEADLRLNEINLAKACICSPINGVVLKRNVDPGQTVASSLQAPVLFSIAEDLRRMELQVDVDEADVGKVKDRAERPPSASMPIPTASSPPTIRDVRFGSETVQGVVTYKAVLTIDNSELLIRPGMTATAEIVVEQVQDALLVPNAALRFSPRLGPGQPARPGIPAAPPAASAVGDVPPAEQAGGDRAEPDRLGAARRRAGSRSRSSSARPTAARPRSVKGDHRRRSAPSSSTRSPPSAERRPVTAARAQPIR